MIDLREHKRAKTRTRPKAGDIKVVNGETYIRCFRRSPCGALVVSGDRFLYEWIKKDNNP